MKIQRYMSGFPSFISENILYDDPKMLEETIRHTKFLYEKKRGRSNFQKEWEDKMKSKVEQRKKGAKTLFFRNTAQAQNVRNSGTKVMETTYGVLGLWPSHMWVKGTPLHFIVDSSS
jgi:hypothetical protein